MVVLKGALIAVFITGGIALISLHYPSIGFWVILVIVSLSFLALVAIGLWERQLSNKKWVFRTSEIPNLDGQYYNSITKSPFVWRSSEPQKEGMFYEIDFNRDQNIIGIQFDHGYSFETPKRWKMSFYDKTGSYVFPCGHEHPYIYTGDPETRQGTSAIIVELNQLIRVYKVQVEILEPRITDGEIQHWRVQAVFLKVRILDNSLTHTIGRFFLDGL